MDVVRCNKKLALCTFFKEIKWCKLSNDKFEKQVHVLGETVWQFGLARGGPFMETT